MSKDIEFEMKPHTPSAMCIFEYVYFARNDTIMEGQQVQTVRWEDMKLIMIENEDFWKVYRLRKINVFFSFNFAYADLIWIK